MSTERRSGKDRCSNPPGDAVPENDPSVKVAIATLAAQLPFISTEMANLRSDISSFRGDVQSVRDAVNDVPRLIDERLKEALKNHVRVEEFVPIRDTVNNAVKLVLAAVLAAMLGLIIIKTKVP